MSLFDRGLSTYPTDDARTARGQSRPAQPPVVLAVLVLSVVLGLASPAGAAADATVDMTLQDYHYVLVFADDTVSPRDNQISLASDETGRMVIADNSGAVSLTGTAQTAGCSQVDSQTVRCPHGRLQFTLGTGNDVASIGTVGPTDDGDLAVEVLGQAGDDVLTSTSSHLVRLFGGDGDDGLTANGSGGLTAYGESGADVITDTGPAGYLSAHGGPGNDTITGTDRGDALYGEEGDDSLQGVAGDDTMAGGDGADVVGGGAGDDNIEGDVLGDANSEPGQGDDVLDGGPGDDRVIGQGGDDSLAGGTGIDEIRAGPGTDQVNARDGAEDRVVSCDTGLDTATVDPSDPNWDDCEAWNDGQSPTEPGPAPPAGDPSDGGVSRSMVIRIAVGKTLTVRDRVVRLRISCPVTATDCTGKLNLSVDGKTQRTNQSLAPGRSRWVPFGLPRSVVGEARRGTVRVTVRLNGRRVGRPRLKVA